MTRGGSFDPSTGVLDAATTSGDITLIRDPALRATLAEWPGTVADLTDVEGLVDQLVFAQLVPWLRLNTPLPEGSFAEFGIPPARSPTDFDLLSSSWIVENYLRELVAWGRILEDTREGLEGMIASIQAGIERSLLVP